MSQNGPQKPDEAGRSSLVLLPGWATDGRVFGMRRWPFRWNSARSFLPRHARGAVEAQLRHSTDRPLTLMGWSLGGYLALEIAKENPGRVARLILVGLRRRYPASDLEGVRRALSRDRSGFLTSFYRQCFLPGLDGHYRHFRTHLLEAYLEEMRSEQLLEGLEYLARQSVVPTELPDCSVIFVHGQRDAVAPVAEARELAREALGADLRVMPGVGHAAFLASGFDEEVIA